MRYKIVFLLECTLFLLSHSYSFAQTVKPERLFYVVTGMGNYEYVHAGVNFTFKSQVFIESAIGIEPWAFSKEKYVMGYISSGLPIFKKKFETKKIKPFFQAKFVLWDYDNAYSHFLVLGFGSEARLVYELSERMKLSANLGLIYNSVLKYERKTFREVGWPLEFPPSFSIQLYYRIK